MRLLMLVSSGFQKGESVSQPPAARKKGRGNQFFRAWKKRGIAQKR
jgi:hypothetical protein